MFSLGELSVLCKLARHHLDQKTDRADTSLKELTDLKDALRKMRKATLSILDGKPLNIMEAANA